VLGIFLTHGHEDHIGGLPFALKKLNLPVYGTRLTLGLLKPKLKEHRILRESDLREVRVGDSVQLGPFRVETISVCHSIPDAVALAIDTPVVRMATQFGRRVAVVGRSLRENFRTARELGFLDVPEGVTVPLADVDRIPPSKLLLLTAGSQGEPMSALTRFAAQRHPFLNVRKD